MEKEKVLEKITSLFKEELWGRIKPEDIGISRFKIIDDLFNSVIAEDIISDAIDMCRSHLKEHAMSVTAAYLIGIIGYHTGRIEDTVHFRKLIDLFQENQKWKVVERISEKILEYGENRVALKALATSLEKFNRNKEAIPVWENLLKIDRFDAEVSKKLALAIIEDDPEKSIQYMKLSIEGFIKSSDYKEISILWNRLVSISWDDLNFFERIEKMLVEAKQFDLTATLLKSLLHKYRDEENPNQSIEILKKILHYTPDDNAARRDLIKLYDTKYGNHSQYQQFLKISRLNNFKSPAKHAIQNFERNIVFDKGNFVFHRSWGVGVITDINSESIVVDFKSKNSHQMSIQMALQSLAPLSKEHIYVLEHEDFEILKTMFKDDFRQFFEILIRSYDNSILVSDIKKEIVPKYIEEKSWSKWWSKARTEIKKDPIFAFSEKKKDLIFMRDKPVTFAEELLDTFTKAQSFSEKLGAAIEFVNNIETGEGESVSQYFIDYFINEAKNSSQTRQILSYFILRSFSRYTDPKKLKLESIREKIIGFIKDSQDLPIISLKIGSYDYKKDFVNLIEESREDWPVVVSDILFETPIRIHKYIINNLIRAHSYKVINGFIDRAITGAKRSPEIFIWVSKNLLSRAWDYDWIDYSKESLILTYFRIMNELKKIETKGNRLKNMTLEFLFDNEGAVLKELVEQNGQQFVSKVYDLFSGLNYIEESHKNKFLAVIKLKYPDFKEAAQAKETEEWVVDAEKLIVTPEGLERMNVEHARMINVDMVNLSQELKKASDVSGDVRENVEYNNLMEKQAILQMASNKLGDEIKKAEVLNISSVSTDAVNVGTKVEIEDVGKGDKNSYVILGPWDADYEKNILSYRSPIAKKLLGKKVGDEIAISIGDDEKKFKILSIGKYR
jgi:transcription elongation factor GreA